MAKDGCGALCLTLKTQCQIAFGQACKCFGNVGCGLIFVDNRFEPVDRSQIFLTVLIIAPDAHFLAGKMIDRKVLFQFGVAGIFAVGETADNIIKRLHGVLGHLLITADIGNLFIVGQCLEVIGIWHIRVGRMK